MKIKQAKSDKEKNELDQLLWDVLWKPLGLPRDIRKSFTLNNPQIELLLVSSPSWDSYQQVNIRSTKILHGMESNFNKCILKFHKMTSDNIVFAVRYAYSSDFGTSQTRETLGCVKTHVCMKNKSYTSFK